MTLEDIRVRNINLTKNINNILPGKPLRKKYNLKDLSKGISNNTAYLYSLFPFYTSIDYKYNNTRDTFDHYQIAGYLKDLLKCKKDVASKELYMPLYTAFGNHKPYVEFDQYNLLRRRPSFAYVYAILTQYKSMKDISRIDRKHTMSELYILDECIKRDLKWYSSNPISKYKHPDLHFNI